MKTTRSSKRGVSRRDFLKWSGVGVGGVALATVLPFSLRGILEGRGRGDHRVRERHLDPLVLQHVRRAVRRPRVRGGRRRPQDRAEGGAEPEQRRQRLHGLRRRRPRPATSGGCAARATRRSRLYDPDGCGRRSSGSARAARASSWPSRGKRRSPERPRDSTRSSRRYGARSIVWFAEDHSFNPIQQDLTDALGTPNFSNHSNLCDTARKASYVATIGTTGPCPTWRQRTSCSSGAGTSSRRSSGSTSPRSSRGPARTTRTSSSCTSTRSSTPPPRRPTLDRAPARAPTAALALALCKYVIDNGTVRQRRSSTTYTLGFDELVRYLNGDGTYRRLVPKAAAWAARGPSPGAATPPSDCGHQRSATHLGTAFTAGRKICIDTWSGPGHHTNATQGGRAINCLNLLLGAVDAAGTMVLPLRNGRPSERALRRPWLRVAGPGRLARDGRDDVRSRTHVPGRERDEPGLGAIKKKYSHSHSSGIYVEMRDRMICAAGLRREPLSHQGARSSSSRTS